jgi:hypothetical protein
MLLKGAANIQYRFNTVAADNWEQMAYKTWVKVDQELGNLQSSPIY